MTPADPGPPFVLAVALVGLAGWVDAIGYLQLGNLFVSFMSGNTTQMAVGLGQGAWREAGVAAALLGLFVLGVFLGTLLASVVGPWQLPVVLGAEAVLLASALVLPPSPAALPAATFPLVLAMGLQNAALPRAGNRRVSLTYVTGTLVNVGRALAEAVSGRGERWGWTGDLLLWLAMAVGATLGAAAFVGVGLRALLVPLGTVLLLAALGIRLWGPRA